jgi:hypothetical protein
MISGKRVSLFIAILLLFTLAIPTPSSVRADAAKAPALGVPGALILYTVPPRTVCVGDTFSVEGGGFVDLPQPPPLKPGEEPGLPPMTVLDLAFSAVHGTVTPDHIVGIGEDFTFSFSYTAKSEGEETITATLNDGIGMDKLRFKVQKSCAYDVFLSSLLDFSADAGDFTVHTLTAVTGTGTMKRVRTTEDALQGDGTWHLEENMLSAPPDCVAWTFPPLLLSGSFELDGELNEDSVDVILAFQPHSGPPVYHGKSTCTDADGNTGEGWGYVMGGGSEAMAAKIQTDFPTAGGSQAVELTGGGMQIVQSVGSLSYTATLTLIPK